MYLYLYPWTALDCSSRKCSSSISLGYCYHTDNCSGPLANIYCETVVGTVSPTKQLKNAVLNCLMDTSNSGPQKLLFCQNERCNMSGWICKQKTHVPGGWDTWSLSEGRNEPAWSIKHTALMNPSPHLNGVGELLVKFPESHFSVFHFFCLRFMVYTSWFLAVLLIPDSELQNSLMSHTFRWYCPHVYGGHEGKLIPQCSWLTKLRKKAQVRQVTWNPLTW